MDEASWLTSQDPEPMLEFIDPRADVRKRRLFACACCRAVWHLIDDPSSQEAVALAERFADRRVTKKALQEAYRRAPERRLKRSDYQGHPEWAAMHAANPSSPAVSSTLNNINVFLTHRPDLSPLPGQSVRPAQADLMREVFGNPFRTLAIDRDSFDRNEGTVRRLAVVIYEGRAFGLLPILADALEEAGCANAELSAHFRSDGPHALGCWALDLILGQNEAEGRRRVRNRPSPSGRR